MQVLRCWCGLSPLEWSIESFCACQNVLVLCLVFSSNHYLQNLRWKVRCEWGNVWFQCKPQLAGQYWECSPKLNEKNPPTHPPQHVLWRCDLCHGLAIACKQPRTTSSCVQPCPNLYARWVQTLHIVVLIFFFLGCKRALGTNIWPAHKGPNLQRQLHGLLSEDEIISCSS